MKNAIRQSDGYVLLLTLVAGTAFLIALSGIATLGFANYKSARLSTLNLDSLEAAEGGGDAAVVALNSAANSSTVYNGTTAPSSNVCALATSSTSSANAVTLYSDAARGRATYETCIQDNTVINSSSNPSQNRYEKIIYSVGKVYQPASSTHARAVSRVQLIVEGSSSGSYAVQTGPGGLALTNSATITNGSVYVGGGLSMSNTSQIGTSSSPVSVYAANYLCPLSAPYTGYPQLCTNSDPISITNSAKIFGSVHANGQTSTNGMSTPGLVQTSGVADVTMPNYDRASQKDAVTTTLSGDQNCGNKGSLTLHANTKIVGNLTMSHTCTVTVEGNVWVTGNVSMTQQAVLRADSSLTTPAVIMVDGSNGFTSGNQSSVATNDSGVGLEVITFYSTAACSPDCANVTGGDLVNSTAITTISLNNQGLADGSAFYARWSAMTLGQGGNIGSVLAQKVILTNSGNIDFNPTNSTATTYAWSVRYYQQMPVHDLGTTN